MNTDVNDKAPTPSNFGAEERDQEVEFLLKRYRGFDMAQLDFLLEKLILKAKRGAKIGSK